MADDLAEDSEDKKRIEKPERAAERKAVKQCKKHTANAGLAARKPRGGPFSPLAIGLPPTAIKPSSPITLTPF